MNRYLKMTICCLLLGGFACGCTTVEERLPVPCPDYYFVGYASVPNDIKEKLRLLESAMEDDPKAGLAYLELLNQALETSPDNASLLNLRADYWQYRDTQRAQADYLRIAELIDTPRTRLDLCVADELAGLSFEESRLCYLDVIARTNALFDNAVCTEANFNVLHSTHFIRMNAYILAGEVWPEALVNPRAIGCKPEDVSAEYWESITATLESGKEMASLMTRNSLLGR